jgi:hypothetical protein
MTALRWTDEFLESMRRVGDAPADDVVRMVIQQGIVSNVNQIMRVLVENDDLPVASLPPRVQQYLTQTDQLPAWADQEKLLAGSRLFNRYGPEIVLMLFGASLPVLYASHPGSEVLVATARMTHNIHRRIIETGQFVFDVTAEDAWKPGGSGIRTSQKVRLMHAATRYYLLDDPNWQQHWRADWHVPICQDDLVGTMLSFSVTVLQSLEICNITLSAEEKEAYLHLWKVVGYLLGIDERLLPDHYEEAVMLMENWMRRNHRPSPAGRELMQAMIDFWYLRVPGKIFDGVTTGWCRLWVGDQLADMLGVPPFNWTLNLLRIQMFIWKHEEMFEDRFPFYQAFTRFWTRALMRTLLAIERGGQRPDFRIPDSLQETWGLR